jgi:uncharacterized membrane protein (DUF373 family)
MNIDQKFHIKAARTSDEAWRVLSLYEKFEQSVAFVLVLLISVVIVVALYHLAIEVADILVHGTASPSNPATFQALFGMIMTLLIAMEFKHSILRVVAGQDSIIQAKTVILIAVMAISRKFIILDTKIISSTEIAALSGALLALGSVYWLMREREDRAKD